MSIDHLPAIDPQALARAEAALDELAGAFLTWADADMAALRVGFASLSREPDQRTEHLRTLATIAHDMKGVAATFGYPLVGRISQELYRLIDDGAVSLPRIGDLIEAMASVLADRLEDDGGEAGRRLINRLGL